jgi:hypothetical protein
MTTEAETRITVGDLKRQLEGYPDDAEITFGCTLDAVPLVFYRVKDRGKVYGTETRLIQIELNELRDEDK